mmetsp:Transcript_29510/g.85397  ORF Transcript_29510/g.85397 Transcript_29510/m.85397 type:complete len:217 (+) Transcript_29510:1242-1892(+)
MLEKAACSCPSLLPVIPSLCSKRLSQCPNRVPKSPWSSRARPVIDSHPKCFCASVTTRGVVTRLTTRPVALEVSTRAALGSHPPWGPAEASKGGRPCSSLCVRGCPSTSLNQAMSLSEKPRACSVSCTTKLTSIRQSAPRCAIPPSPTDRPPPCSTRRSGRSNRVGGIWSDARLMVGPDAAVSLVALVLTARSSLGQRLSCPAIGRSCWSLRQWPA